MQLDDLLSRSVVVPGTLFTTKGLQCDVALGNGREVVRSAFTGTIECCAPVSGRIEIEKAFVFAGGEIRIGVNARVGAIGTDAPPEPAMVFTTKRPGSVGGMLDLTVNARIDRFEFVDQTYPGGFGQKQISIDAVCGKVRVVAKQSANRSSYVLRITGNPAQRAAIEVTTGRPLTVETSEEDGWLVCVIADPV